MKESTIHARDTRLFVNAGMKFPLCYAGAELLDTDKGRLITASNTEAVTCKRCKAILNKEKK